MIQHAFKSTINTGTFFFYFQIKRIERRAVRPSFSRCSLRWCIMFRWKTERMRFSLRQCVHTDKRTLTAMRSTWHWSNGIEETKMHSKQHTTLTTKIKLISNLQIYDFNNPFDLAACSIHRFYFVVHSKAEFVFLHFFFVHHLIVDWRCDVCVITKQ